MLIKLLLQFFNSFECAIVGATTLVDGHFLKENFYNTLQVRPDTVRTKPVQYGVSAGELVFFKHALTRNSRVTYSHSESAWIF